MLPAVVQPRLQRQLAADVDEAHQLVGSLLFDLRLQPERAGWREIAEPDIRKISALRQRHFQKHMDGRAGRIDRQPAHDTPLQARDRVAKRPQSRAEQHVLLEAVSAASAADHLVLKRRHIELGRLPEHDVQRLVGDRVRVRENETIQGLERRRDGSRIADARKPSALIELRL